MRPVVAVTACHKQIEDLDFDCAGHRYGTAVAEAGGCLPLILPTMGAALDLPALLESVDGLLFTGSPSNVAPEHYGGRPARPDVAVDPRRDATTLPLMRAALETGIPLFAICRGHQELNVALGGSLHQHVEEVAGHADHREVKGLPAEQRYAPAHAVTLTHRGLLHALTGRDRLTVNSLHGQGIDRPAPGLAVEATADDGLVEAVRVTGARRFALGVQWHPEWEAVRDPVSASLFRAFAEACQDRRRERNAP